jgi:Domain of unknown function (DUF4266)
MKPTIQRALCLAAMLAISGCAMQPPQAWEKGNLARKDMSLNSDPLDSAFLQHVYFSKEAASGGTGVGGGGCGCN